MSFVRALVFAAAVALLAPQFAFAAAKQPAFEVSGWIPYWRAATGTLDVLAHTQNLTSIMPFGYVVQNDGTLHDAFGLEDASATSSITLFRSIMQASKIKIVPTVMWSNSAAIHDILSNGPKRRALEDAIVHVVKDNGYDGIDIDFEGKFARTKPFFSLFLQGLYQRMGTKLVYCAIEPRTPPSSAYEVIPPTINYSTDYTAVNKYCDRVEIMTYDQGAGDIKLNKAANGQPYVPVSDPAWVKKVVNLAAQYISKKKIVLGVPTYGYEYDVVPLSQGYRYDINWAFNPRYATDLAATLGVTPTRNSAGELSFLYSTSTEPTFTSAGIAGAMPAYAAATSSMMQRIVWWSDAAAVGQKVDLARELGLRGVAIFKFDGGEDPNLWNYLPTK